VLTILLGLVAIFGEDVLIKFFLSMAIFYAIAIPVVAFVVLARTARLRQEIGVLKAQLLRQERAPDPRAAAPQTQEEDGPAEPDSVALAQLPDAAPAVFSEISPTPEPKPVNPPYDSDAKSAGAVDGTDPVDGEYELTSKWLVWAGGIALALGGIFLARYAISVGVLTPLVRIVLGVMAGAAMVSAGEAARRWSVTTRFWNAGSDRVPAILSGAGLITLFASVYAADSFYGLIPPFLTFVLLVVLSLGALALALLHGPALGLLGLVGCPARGRCFHTWLLSPRSWSPQRTIATGRGLAGPLLAAARPGCWRGWREVRGVIIFRLASLSFMSPLCRLGLRPIASMAGRRSI